MEFFLSTANRGEINHSVFLGPGGGFGAKEISPPPPLFQRFSISRFNFPRPSTPFSRPLSNPHPLSRPHATAKKKQRVLNFNLWYFFFPIPKKKKNIVVIPAPIWQRSFPVWKFLTVYLDMLEKREGKNRKWGGLFTLISRF